MASLKVVNMEGADVGAVDATESVFAAPLNEAMVHDVVVGLLANKRQGTHKTKNRGEVSGGGIKPFRQKGTGRARQGSSREPHMRGGGTIFGPVPRDYRQNLPVRMKRQALCCALSERVRGERLSVLRGLAMEQPKTKPFAQMVGKVAPEGRKTLIVTAGMDENILLSARNLPRVTVRTAADVNVLDVLRAVRIVVQEEAVAQLEERLS
jgi:large subunit ribosomal protein L4